MAIVKIHEAKTTLSKLIARVEAGEEIVIARGDQPVAKLTAVQGDTSGGSEPYMVPGTLRARITTDPEVCGGRPCLRGLRVRVGDVLGWLASGMSREAILADYPYLEPADIDAALAYAAGAVDHCVVRP